MIPAKHSSESIAILAKVLLYHGPSSYALSELKKDVEEELAKRPESEREALRAATKFGIFVVHNKKKPKLAELPEGTPFVLSSSPTQAIPNKH